MPRKKSIRKASFPSAGENSNCVNWTLELGPMEIREPSLKVSPTGTVHRLDDVHDEDRLADREGGTFFGPQGIGLAGHDLDQGDLLVLGPGGARRNAEHQHRSQQSPDQAPQLRDTHHTVMPFPPSLPGLPPRTRSAGKTSVAVVP